MRSVKNIARKASKGLCLTARCLNRAATACHYCHKCRKRKYREAHPERYAYENLRRSAQLRRIAFLLTFEQWLEFIQTTEYDPARRGCHEGALTVDRIDSSRGYESGNIRPLEFMENSTRPHRRPMAAGEDPW